MTDKLIMTTAQRVDILKAMTDSDNFRAIFEMLQSLPMVDSAPAIYTVFDEDGDPAVSFLTRDDCHQHINEAVMNDIPDAAKCYVRALYTSPQALTNITADDVTDEMVREWHVNVFSTQTTHSTLDKHMIAGAVNAVLKHKSEASDQTS